MGNTAIGRGQTRIVQRPSTFGNTASSARAPWPTPPLGRAGAAVGGGADGGGAVIDRASVFIRDGVIDWRSVSALAEGRNDTPVRVNE